MRTPPEIAEIRIGAGKDRQGVIILLTLGTGIGSAVFLDGKLLPNSEFGHLMIRGKEAEKRASEKVREQKQLSWQQWAERLSEFLNELEKLFSPDLFIMGGGISKKAEKFFPYPQDSDRGNCCARADAQRGRNNRRRLLGSRFEPAAVTSGDFREGSPVIRGTNCLYAARHFSIFRICAKPPTGTVSFLFTDIVGKHPALGKISQADGWGLARHDSLIHSAVEDHPGPRLQDGGRCGLRRVPSPRNSLEAAIDAQRALNSEGWKEIGSSRAVWVILRRSGRVSGR